MALKPNQLTRLAGGILSPTPEDPGGTSSDWVKISAAFLDIYDAFDGWGTWGFWPERLFDSIDEARACRDQLNTELSEDNRSAGEHWAVIDRMVCSEVECVRRW